MEGTRANLRKLRDAVYAHTGEAHGCMATSASLSVCTSRSNRTVSGPRGSGGTGNSPPACVIGPVTLPLLVLERPGLLLHDLARVGQGDLVAAAHDIAARRNVRSRVVLDVGVGLLFKQGASFFPWDGGRASNVSRSGTGIASACTTTKERGSSGPPLQIALCARTCWTVNLQGRQSQLERAHPLVAALRLERRVLPVRLVHDECRESRLALSLKVCDNKISHCGSTLHLGARTFDSNVARGNKVTTLDFQKLDHALAKSLDLLVLLSASPIFIGNPVPHLFERRVKRDIESVSLPNGTRTTNAVQSLMVSNR